MPSISQILQKEFADRQKYVSFNKLEAFRAYDRSSSELPLAIDIYKDNAVIHLFAPISDEKMKDVEQELTKYYRCKKFFYKNRTKNDINLPQTQKKEFPVEEYGHKFWCNLSDYLDTGLFLDHRETRKWIQKESKDKTVLNTFAYTGSFSIYAAAGGAKKTYSVDLSGTYCDWIKKNLELNHLPPEKNWVYKMDTREFFRYAKKKNLTFDIIIIDPPSFSRNKGNSFSVQQDHPELINAALEVLNPEGFIVFSNNKQDFRLNKEKLLPCKVQNIQPQTIPADFTEKNIHYCFLMRPV